MSRSGWVLRSVESLNRVGSWSGRIHVHKLLYLGDRLAKLDQPFEFKIYRYGPYSFDLDEAVRELTASSLLEHEVVDPAYGPKYSPTSDFSILLEQSSLDLTPNDKARLSSVADRIGDRKSSELELIATCIWAFQDEGLEDDEAVVARVHALKPRYDLPTISDHLAKAKELMAECAGI